jgi:hypothetical protein
MRKNIEKEENEMHQIFQGRKEIEKYIKDIKELISKIQNQDENLISGISNSELIDALIISLFVLEVGFFEHWLKNLVWELKKNERKNIISWFISKVRSFEHWLKKLIFELKNKIKNREENRDEFFKKTTLGKAIEFFKKEISKRKEEEINLSSIWSFKFLRSFVNAAGEINNLRNDLYHNLYREGLLKKEILNNIEKRLESNLSIKKYFIEEGRDSKVSRSLISNGKLPNNWTIEILEKIVCQLIQDLYQQQGKIKINKKRKF